MNPGRKLRMGMIGGSNDAFIGAVHRMAAALDGRIELVCGAFSANSEKSVETGNQLFLDENRTYASYKEMIVKEKELSASERMDFVSVVTPNHLHFEPCMLALENGFHVMCEKPLAFDQVQANQLEETVKKSGLVFGLTHNYTAYPMIKEARHLVKTGALGKVFKIIAEYQQGWLATKIESEGQKQASWRTNPAYAGISCCVADIGTHAENLAEYITGLKITELCADISSFIEDRSLEDDANILLRFDNGAKGVMVLSQVTTGEENELKIRIFGELGSLEWLQSDPNHLILKFGNEPKKVLKPGNSYLSAETMSHTRLPSGHPEGYIEALANLYKSFGNAVAEHIINGRISSEFDFPDVSDGVRGMKFIKAVIDSGKTNSAWVKL